MCQLYKSRNYWGNHGELALKPSQRFKTDTLWRQQFQRRISKPYVFTGESFVAKKSQKIKN
jgi:hypothetical protein